MARKGFLTELHRVAKQVARGNDRQRMASQRAYEAALRQAEAAQMREQQANARAMQAARKREQQAYTQALKSDARAQKESIAELSSPLKYATLV